ncbi:hypothetical protein [Rubritalea tangerina]|uniref:Uncharacterized protein n=1 Tax=Rubritalea tangerina TaxID=430798 RepID=A0ABW4ZA05_9BACT
MKYTITTLAALGFVALSSCGDKPKEHNEQNKHTNNEETNQEHSHGEHDPHDGHDHSSCSHDHSGHDHGDHAGHSHVKAGPNRGRMIQEIQPQAEFLVLEDGRVQISFFDQEMKNVSPSDQVVSVVSGERISPVEMSFSREGDVLVSKQSLPKGNNFPTVVAIKPNANAEEVTSKFTLNLSDCSSCDNKEYACECHH